MYTLYPAVFLSAPSPGFTCGFLYLGFKRATSHLVWPTFFPTCLYSPISNPTSSMWLSPADRLQSMAKLVAISFLDPIPKGGCVSFPTSTPHPQSNKQVSNTSLGTLLFGLILTLSTWRWYQIPQGKGLFPQDSPPTTTTSATSYKFRSLPVPLIDWLWIGRFHDLLLDRLILQGSSQK